MSTQHTPGPWAYKISRPAGILEVRSVGEPIAHCYGPDRNADKPHYTERGAKTVFGADCERSEANARLIAAAPDLLAALRLAAEDLQLVSDENGGSHGRTLDKILSAINKAEGRA